METQQEIINFYKEETSKVNGQFNFTTIAELVNKAASKYGEDEAMVALNTWMNTFKKTNK